MTRISTLSWLLVVALAVSSIDVNTAFVIKTQKTSGSRIQQCSSSSLSMITTTTTEQVIVGDPLIVDKLPEPLPKLKNDFYLLRHGQSTANVAGIISSSRSLAYSKKHGLTELGWEQGKAAAPQLLQFVQEKGGTNSNNKIIFVSSPFARAYETAQACMEGVKELQTAGGSVSSSFVGDIEPEIQIQNDLMERYFGTLDGEPLATYGYVWPQDMVDPLHTDFDVESVGAVATRLRQVIVDLDETYSDSSIVLVSHADVLQICQLYAANMGERVGEFSSYRFTNGEVRAMKSTPDTLPEPVPLEAPKEVPGKTTPPIPK